MPITETQTDAASPPPSEPPRAPRRGKRNDYEGLEAYDLLHVIDDLEDERARALLREKIWIALLLHMAVFLYIIFGPRYIRHVKVVDAPLSAKSDEKQMTVLDLPPDALKHLGPRQPAPPRESAQPAPAPSAKALQAPPTPAPAKQPEAPKPQVAAAAPAPPTPQPVQRPALPLPQNKSAQVDAPAPRPTQPVFNSGPSTPGEAVQQAARQAARGGAYGVGDDAPGGAPQHGGMNGAVDVLSPTLGVDFGPYIQRVIYDTKKAWYPIIPPSAQPPLSKQGRVLIRFKIMPDGSVKEMTLEGPSGDVSLDRAAWGGIKYGAPFPQLPKDFKGPFLELRFYFLYNERPGVQ